MGIILGWDEEDVSTGETDSKESVGKRKSLA
jgi:hypothetical protein